jgi:hypothetical protein
MLYRINRSVPINRKTMRPLKGTAIVVLVAIYTFALSGSPAIVPLWAQTARNPLIAPVPPPAAPAQLPAPVTTAIAPILAPVPTLALATPTPSVRSFNCSCSGRGIHTNWMGTVSAPGFFAARQSAVGECLAYNRNREPSSPTQTARGAVSTSVPILPGANVPGAAAQLTSSLPGTLNSSTAADLQNCANCVCN